MSEVVIHGRINVLDGNGDVFATTGPVELGKKNEISFNVLPLLANMDDGRAKVELEIEKVTSA